MARVKIRYLVAKPQKNKTIFYWQPSKALAEAGFLTRRLSDVYAEALGQAEALNRELDDWRAGRVEPPIKPDTIPYLIRLYQQSNRYLTREPKTRRGYEQSLRKIEEWSRSQGDPPIAGITLKAVAAFNREMSATPFTANATMRVLRLLLNFAVREGLIERNPAKEVEIRAIAPRDVVWPAEHIEKLCTHAREQGRDSIALAVVMAVNLGQREGDLLALTWESYDDESVLLRQRKTKVMIRVTVTEVLKAALDATPRRSAHIIVNEQTGEPYKEDNFRHVFADLRTGAGIDSRFRFMDLRRTAVVRLAEAGATEAQIAAITGHSLANAGQILETYLPRNAEMARGGIRLLDRYGREGKLDL